MHKIWRRSCGFKSFCEHGVSKKLTRQQTVPSYHEVHDGSHMLGRVIASRMPRMRHGLITRVDVLTNIHENLWIPWDKLWSCAMRHGINSDWWSTISYELKSWQYDVLKHMCAFACVCVGVCASVFFVFGVVSYKIHRHEQNVPAITCPGHLSHESGRPDWVRCIHARRVSVW